MYAGDEYEGDDYFPYPNEAVSNIYLTAFFLTRYADSVMQMMRTDALFSSPRLRFSRAQQEAVLRYARDLGAKVPSLHALHAFQQKSLAAVGNPTVEVKAASGNTFSMNDVRKLLFFVSQPCSRLAQSVLTYE